MSDTQKYDPPSRPTAPNGDEDIIDLVEEIPEGSPQHPLSELEQRLLDFGDQPPAAGSTDADLPELADLDSIDFDEEEDAPAAAAETASGSDMAPPSVESVEQPTVPGNEIEEIFEFDEQLLDAEDIFEVEDILAGPLPAEKDPEPEEDQNLELIDVEEEEIDDEIVWFDDLETGAPAPEPMTEDAPPQATALDSKTDSGRETSALDVFAAHVETGLQDPKTDPSLASAELGAASAAAAAAAAFQAPVESAPGVSSPDSADAPLPVAAGHSPTEIEAALERVIERKLGGTIESIIQQAIETAVSKEIERLKRLLLEDDDRGAAP
jgi:hypothetical protein